MTAEGGRFRHPDGESPPDEQEDWGPEHYEDYWGGYEDEDLEQWYAKLQEKEEEEQADLGEELEDKPDDSKEHQIAKLVKHASYGWRYDNTGHYAYVLLNGDEAMRNEVIARLKVRGIETRATDRSRKLADNGKRYEWYLRVFDVSDGEDKHPERHVVANVLSEVSGYEPDESKEFLEYLRRTSKLEEELTRLKADLKDKKALLRRRLDRNRELEDLLERRRRGWRELHDRYVQSQNEAAELVRRSGALSSHVEKLREEKSEKDKDIGKLSASLSRVQADFDEWLLRQDELLSKREREEERETKELQDELQESRDLLYVIEDELAAKESELASARDQLAVLERERHAARQQLEHAQDSSSQRAPNTLDKVLGCLLPNLQFCRGSTDILFKEFDDPSGALQILRKLNSEPGSMRSERVEGKEFKEERFSTGQAGERRPKGRLYYKKGNEKGLYEVQIEKKGTQQKDIKSMR